MSVSRPEPTTIQELGLAVYPSFAMLAGMQLDVFTPLKGGSMTAEGIANELGVSPSKLQPLLYALVKADLLIVDEGRFANTEEAEHYLVRTSPNYLEGRDQFYWDRWNEVLNTAKSIRTGEPQAKLDFAAMSEEELLSTMRGMNSGAMSAGRDLAGRHDFSGGQSLVDVGGGSGGLSVALADAYPDLRTTVVDLPTVTPITQRFVKEAGVEDRVEVLTADAANEPIGGPYDIAVMRAFLQILSPENVGKVLRNTAQALRSGAPIFILGLGILDNSRLSPRKAVVFNLVFINVYDDGQAYTIKEYEQWLTEAGFQDFERITLPGGGSIVKANKS